jgi:predicted transcriptional regulator
MPKNLTSLQHSKLESSVVLKQAAERSKVSTHSLATEVMTDLEPVSAYTITPSASIIDAENKMIFCGVRLLFVTNTDNNLVGIITATDILGARPLNYL